MSLDDYQPENAWKLFMLVFRLSLQTESWRIRHSAALCLEISSALRSPQAHVHVMIDSIRREMFDVGLQLLQDGGPDVRYTAMRALPPGSSTNVVPEMVLSRSS